MLDYAPRLGEEGTFYWTEPLTPYFHKNDGNGWIPYNLELENFL